jgi:predicted permease
MVDWAAYVRTRLRLPHLQADREAEVVEEIARQLDDAYREALVSGATDDEARQIAEGHIADWPTLGRQLSRSPRLRTPLADRWTERLDDRSVAARGGFTRTDRLRQDVVYAWRLLRRGRGISAAAILSLALGIGANTALFSVLSALMFKQVAVPRADELVSLTDPATEGFMTGIESGERTLLSFHEFEGLSSGNDVLAGLLAFSGENIRTPVTTAGAGDTREADPAGAGGAGADESAAVSLVSGGYFPVLGVAAATGSTYGPEVDAAGLAHPVAVLSHRFWTRRFAADPRVVGRTIRLRTTAFEIVGVMPPQFTGLVVGSPPDLWVPITMQQAVAPGADWLTQPAGTARRTMFLHVVGRLKAGVGLEQASAALTGVLHRGLNAEAAQIADADRRRDLLDARLVVRSVPYGLSALRSEYARPLVVLMALVGLLLLLTCANVSNLLLARSAGRRRELAVRVAMGAGRARLMRQLLTESVLLAALGAAAGLLVAYWGDRLLLRLVFGAGTAMPLETPLDAPVLAFTAGLTLLTGGLFGLAPALRATRVDPNGVLRGAAHTIAGTAGRARGWPVGRVLAAVQMALSLVLLIVAGLFVRSLVGLGTVPLGYDTDGLVMFRISGTAAGYEQPAVAPLVESLLDRIRAVPGITAATYSFEGLFHGIDMGSDISLAGSTPPAGRDMSARFDLVGPAYFRTLGIPVLAGRDVERQDATGLPGCWVNDTAARHFFEGEHPVGRRIVTHFSFGDFEFEIRGVVADSRAHSVRGEIARRFYLPFAGSVTRPTSAVFELRTATGVAAVTRDVRRALRDIDSRLANVTFYTVPELIAGEIGRDRLTAQLSALFAVMALVVASIGLYGLLSYDVTRRSGEIGVRLALGAGRAGIVGLIVRDALSVTAAGAGVGLAVAFATTHLLTALLYGLSPQDLRTFAAAGGVLLVVAVLAAAIPAWRAARTDPLVALRTE